MVSSAELIRSIGKSTHHQACSAIEEACCFSVFLPNHYRALSQGETFLPLFYLEMKKQGHFTGKKNPEQKQANDSEVHLERFTPQPPAARSLDPIPGRPGILLLLRLRREQSTSGSHRGDQVPALKTGLGTLEV